MNRKVRWEWKVLNLTSLSWWSDRTQMLHSAALAYTLHDTFWITALSYFVVTQVIWVFRSAGGYNNPLFNNSKHHVSWAWGHSCAASVKQLCMREYANRTESRHWLFTRQLSESVSSFSAGKIDNYSAPASHGGGGLRCWKSQHRCNWKLQTHFSDD